MELFVEPAIRRLVADRLGVDVKELVRAVSLRDDLAADSLDLVDVAIALEAEFGIVVPERILDSVRSYGDLVQATAALIRTRGDAEARAVRPPVQMWARVAPRAGESGGILTRAGWLTPYAAETIAEDAARAGHGAQVDVTVAAGTDDSELTLAQHRFAWLRMRDVHVTVRRADRPLTPPFTHRVLDELTGTATTVTVADYVEDRMNEPVLQAASPHARYYQTGLSTEVGPSGELVTSREATCYSQDREGRGFDVASSLTRLTSAGQPSDRQQGLRARFDLSARSPNDFRPLTATLDGTADGGACTLRIHCSVQVGGKQRFAQVALRRGAEPMMDVRLLPLVSAAPVCEL